MSKGVLVGIVLFVLVSAGVGGYYIYTKSPSSTQVATTSNSDDSSMAEGSEDLEKTKVSGSFEKLLTLGENYSCTFDYSDEVGNSTQGKVYVAAGGNKLSGEFEMTDTGGAVYTTNIVRNGTESYVWTPADGKGYKMTIDETDTSIFSASGESDSSVGLKDDTNVDFDCSKWNVNNSVFVAPSHIEFTDISAMMQLNEGNVTDLKDTQCAACDQLPSGESKDACLSAFECN